MWVEAKSYKVLNAKQVAKFIQNDIICRYGVPHEFISDRGTHFQAETELILQKYKIKHHKSSPYRPQTNDAVEAANKTVATILRKMTDNYREWPEKIPFALWGYRTSIRTATGATPYYLVYGMEVVQPVELEIPSLRILLESEVPEADWVQAPYDSQVILHECRLNALYHVQLYQKRIERAFNKKVKPRGIKEEDLVLKSVRALLPVDPRGKFKPNCRAILGQEDFVGWSRSIDRSEWERRCKPNKLRSTEEVLPLKRDLILKCYEIIFEIAMHLE
ncbi:uncharacterized protein LOC141588086 [Silene latifolia]|uniref:uncharacterized protein LOC141588086 n=1 Tax=Silene latifolia TaxID=37657 RepID=UPI003D76F203